MFFGSCAAVWMKVQLVHVPSLSLHPLMNLLLMMMILAVADSGC
jgi:hypothetical protein